MSARYWVLFSGSLLRAGAAWPEGLRLARSAEGLGEPRAPGAQLPGAAWRLVEDDGAPPELDGQRVQLVLLAGDGGLSVAARNVVP